MEKRNERVLAYKLAKEIDNDELDNVSGGSVHKTTRVTGDSARGPDCEVDVTVDW